MRPSTKPIYSYVDDGPAVELPEGWQPSHKEGKFACYWDDFQNKWKFEKSSWNRWDTVYNKEEVPVEFRAYLMLLEIAP
jgi:hypothetical protein